MNGTADIDIVVRCSFTTSPERSFVASGSSCLIVMSVTLAREGSKVLKVRVSPTFSGESLIDLSNSSEISDHPGV